MSPVAAVAVALLAAAAPASAHLFLSVDAASERGHATVIAIGSSYHESVTYGETIRSVAKPRKVLAMGPFGLHPEYGPLDFALHEVPWRCDLRDRRFFLTGTAPDGTAERSEFAVRTPSCRNRLALDAPRRGRPGRPVRVTVADTWKGGRVDARLCVRPPSRESRCRSIAIGDGVERVARTLRPRRPGRWRVVLTGPEQRIAHTLAVGVGVREADPAATGPTVLVTGDSMMQSVDAVLGDDLAGQATVVSDIRIGTGISKPGERWHEIAAAQVAEHEPAATVVLLGTNDGFPMPIAGGPPVPCCGAPWIAEYTRRARLMMRAYAQDGAGEVVWLTVPAASDERRSVVYAAVNAALDRAAESEGLELLRADETFTPGGAYRAAMRVGGRRVRVRERDGIHFSIAGSRVAAAAIVAQLEEAGVLDSR